MIRSRPAIYKYRLEDAFDQRAPWIPRFREATGHPGAPWQGSEEFAGRIAVREQAGIPVSRGRGRPGRRP